MGTTSLTLFYDVVSLLRPAQKVYKLDNLEIGKSKTSSIDIQNMSDSAISINDIYSETPNMKIASDYDLIEPDSMISISFTIIPVKIGYCTAEIILNTDLGIFRFKSHGLVKSNKNN